IEYWWDETVGWSVGTVVEDPVKVIDELIITVTFDDDGSTHRLPLKGDEKARFFRARFIRFAMRGSHGKWLAKQLPPIQSGYRQFRRRNRFVLYESVPPCLVSAFAQSAESAAQSGVAFLLQSPIPVPVHKRFVSEGSGVSGAGRRPKLAAKLAPLDVAESQTNNAAEPAQQAQEAEGPIANSQGFLSSVVPPSSGSVRVIPGFVSVAPAVARGDGLRGPRPRLPKTRRPPTLFRALGTLTRRRLGSPRPYYGGGTALRNQGDLFLGFLEGDTYCWRGGHGALVHDLGHSSRRQKDPGNICLSTLAKRVLPMLPCSVPARFGCLTDRYGRCTATATRAGKPTIKIKDRLQPGRPPRAGCLLAYAWAGDPMPMPMRLLIPTLASRPILSNEGGQRTEKLQRLPLN
ncbi:hypothetical protein THAOC_31110, partial [Thalassiosira oceanica]